MPIPVNIDALNAFELSLTLGVTQDANDAGTTYTLWYKHTATIDGVVTVFAYGDNVNYFIRPRVFDGPAAVPVDYLSFNAAPVAQDRPIQVPVYAGNTYFFSFTSDLGNVSPAVLNLSSTLFTNSDEAIGDIYINDEDEGYPLAILDPTTAAVKKFINGIVNGEQGAFLPSGVICLEDVDDNNAVIYQGTTLVATVSFPHAPSSFIKITSNRSNKFYLGNRGSGATLAFVQELSTAGVLGAIHTLPVSGLYGMACALDDSILYWAIAGVNVAIQRFDLVNDVALSDLVAGIASYDVMQDMFVLSDGTILAGHSRNATTNPACIVKQYSAAGAILNTYNFNTGTTTTHRLALNPDNLSFWLKYHGPDGLVTFQHVRISDGVTLATLTSFEFKNGKSQHAYAFTPSVPSGNAASCPFWISEVAGPPATTGNIVVNKATVPSTDPAIFQFTADGMDPVEFSLAHGESRTFSNLIPGIYGITEIQVAGYLITYTVSNSDEHDAITIAAGDTVTVTVTNTLIGSGGIYKIQPDKRNDTLYETTVPETTVDVKIPNPRVHSALLG